MRTEGKTSPLLIIIIIIIINSNSSCVIIIIIIITTSPPHLRVGKGVDEAGEEEVLRRRLPLPAGFFL